MKSTVTESLPPSRVSPQMDSRYSWRRTVIEATALLVFIFVVAFLI